MLILENKVLHLKKKPRRNRRGFFTLRGDSRSRTDDLLHAMQAL
jgi:hypothetical protein